jgi:hypothetical protein
LPAGRQLAAGIRGQIFHQDSQTNGYSAGQDARLYGRPESCRYIGSGAGNSLSGAPAPLISAALMTDGKPRISEDWLSLWTGLIVFVLSLGAFMGTDLLGFGAKVGIWTDPAKAITPVAASCKWMPAWLAVVATYLFMGAVVGTGNWLLGGEP